MHLHLFGCEESSKAAARRRTFFQGLRSFFGGGDIGAASGGTY